MGSVFLLWHTNNRLNPVVLGLNLVCSLQLLVSNCLLNCEVFSSANYFSHACHKQNLEAVLCRSSSMLNPELRQQNGKSSWPFYGAQFLQQAGLRGWWQPLESQRQLGFPGMSLVELVWAAHGWLLCLCGTEQGGLARSSFSITSPGLSFRLLGPWAMKIPVQELAVQETWVVRSKHFSPGWGTAVSAAVWVCAVLSRCLQEQP